MMGEGTALTTHTCHVCFPTALWSCVVFGKCIPCFHLFQSFSFIDDSNPASPSSDISGLVAEPNLSGRSHTLIFSSSEVSALIVVHLSLKLLQDAPPRHPVQLKGDVLKHAPWAPPTLILLLRFVNAEEVEERDACVCLYLKLLCIVWKHVLWLSLTVCTLPFVLPALGVLYELWQTTEWCWLLCCCSVVCQSVPFPTYYSV